MVVKNLGKRIRELRDLHGFTRTQLRARTGVSRTYLSRVESGEMTPKLITIEKLAEAFGIGMNYFFVPPTNNDRLLDDPFMRELRPYLQRLKRTQWREVIRKLCAINGYGESPEERAVSLKRAAQQRPLHSPAYYSHPPAATLHG
jgi:transcriptional regulator with XRE-family HTH domain